MNALNGRSTLLGSYCENARFVRHVFGEAMSSERGKVTSKSVVARY